MVGKGVELVACQHFGDRDSRPMNAFSATPYWATPTLFAREDSVEAAWQIVDPILKNPTPVHEYEPNTWGPAEADRIIAGDGGWHNPTPMEPLDDAVRESCISS